MSGVLQQLKHYTPTLYPVKGVRLDADASDDPQDSHVLAEMIKRGALAETAPPPETVTLNVCDELGITKRGYSRKESIISRFLDGTRRTYLVAEMATTGKRYFPVVGGQISAAVLHRDKETGKVSTYRHHKRRLMLVPGGGRGMNADDVRLLAANLRSRGSRIEVETYKCRAKQDPREAAIARVNRLMQALEVQALEALANNRLLTQEDMLVVDGSVQFQNISGENLSWLKHVIGVAKTFNTHISFLKDGTEVGAMLARALRKTGDRTAAFRWKMDEQHQYAIWYLRIRQPKQVDSPLGGIIKVEKLLTSEAERETGLRSDTVNNLSASLVGERYVTCYGRDARWPNHLYPIYLAEGLQRVQFLSDAHFLRLF